MDGPAAAVAATVPAPPGGVLLMIGAMLIIPLMDVAAKLLTVDLPLWQIVWARFFFHAALLLPLYLVHHRVSELANGNPVAQVVRASLLIPATALFYAAIAGMPLADALAVFFLYPCIVTVLAAVFLGDRVGVWRWSATAVGFVGALVVIQPGPGFLSNGAVLALGSSVFVAIYMVMTRHLAGRSPPLVTQLMTGLVGIAICSFAAIPVWQPPTIEQWALMGLMGATSLVAHLMMVLAYERSQASLLAPISYLEIVSATALAYMVFGDFPNSTTWIGIAIIIASGLLIAWRESVRGVTSSGGLAVKS